MKRNTIVLTAVVLVVAGMLIAGQYLARRNGLPQPAAEQPLLQIEGRMAPDFTLEDLNGGTVSLADYRGKAVVLNFWATWCAPCKIEMPWFDELHKRYRGQGVEIVGIAMDEGADKKDVAKFARDVGAEYTILMGNNQVGDAYGGVQFLPATFYIDRQGRVVKRVFGLAGQDEIEENIKLALSAASNADLPASSASAATEHSPNGQ